MRHDAKLGLALGMLVIGFAVAFCFPRQPARTVTRNPEPAATIRDSALHFLPIRAYQNELPSPAPNVPASPTPIITSVEVTPVTIAGRKVDPNMLVSPPVAEAGIDAIAVQRSTPPPVTPLFVVAEPARPPEKKPGVDVPAPASPKVDIHAQSRPETYEVKPGDTLSGIAAQLLGSANKYRELYEANRELLSSPNDLKIGMKLKIPSAVPSHPARDDLAGQTRSWAGPPKPGRKILVESPPEPSPPASRPSTIQEPPKAPWLAERSEERR